MAGWQDKVIEQLTESGDKFEALGEGKVWATRSKSDAMKVYYLFVLPWIVICTCDGFRYRSDCSHARELLDIIEGGGVD